MKMFTKTKLIAFLFVGALHIAASLCDQKLLLVNLINRHGDRAPTCFPPKGDQHAELVDVFWPNGLGNLTEEGILRMKQLADTMKCWYHDVKLQGMTDNDKPSFLALSSGVQRCKDSLMTVLEGFYGTQLSYPKGSPTNPEPFDTKLVPSLDFKFMYYSPYVRARPYISHGNYLEDPTIASTFGINRLMDVLKERYNVTILNNTALSILSTIRSEIEIDKHQGSMDYSDHYNWTGEVLLQDPETNNTLTLFEVFDRVTLLAFVNQLDSKAAYLTSAPIITSLVESMQVQIDDPHDQPKPTWRQFAYRNRDIIFYSSHDTVITRVLVDMGIIKLDTSEPFERQLMRLKRRNSSDVDLYLSGMIMAHFGLSLRFSLWKVADENQSVDWLVRLDVYNEADWSKPVEYQPVKLGKFCIEQYGKLAYGESTVANAKLPLEFDPDNDCKFNVFKKILNDKLLNDYDYKRIYSNVWPSLVRTL